MEENTMTRIQDMSEEYRKHAGRLKDIHEYFAGLRTGMDEPDEVIERSITRIEGQIHELNSIADALQEVVFNYRKAQRRMSYTDIDFGSAEKGREFGISEFANLSEHADLIPIHTSVL